MATTIEQAISARKRDLGNQYAYLTELEEIAELRAARHASENPYSHQEQLEYLGRPIRRFDGVDLEPRRAGAAQKKQRDHSDIRSLVHDLHAKIWASRRDIFPNHASMRPVDMLDPIVAFSLYGYNVETVGALGQHESSKRHLSNVAGLIDSSQRKVLLSSGFSPAVRKFTAAHELGHAALHDFVGAHRDLPLDGSGTGGDPQEREANLFAVTFLMPQKLVTKIFEQVFGQSPFVLDDDRRFALAGSLPNDRWAPTRVRDLSRVLASASRFNGNSFQPLMTQFGVSKEAMAIRLEELGLVQLVGA